MTEEIPQKPTAFRPIAPSVSKISSLTTSVELKKRKWSDSIESIPVQGEFNFLFFLHS